ncbi:MAG: hypothetical protein PVJ27_01225, partial [Candidatus Brocadiaceae bacterium]
MPRNILSAAVLIACLLSAACDGRGEQRETELRAQIENWREKYESTLSKNEALSAQLDAAQADAEARRDEMERLQAQAAELPDLREQVKALQSRVRQLENAAAEAGREEPSSPTESAGGSPPVARIRDRLQQVGRDLFEEGNHNAAYPVLLSANQLGA